MQRDLRTEPSVNTADAAVTPLYTTEQRQRRDASRWTWVQGVLAPLQFVVFGISVVLVLRYLTSGVGADAAAMSVLVKTLILYTIMVTGALWEHDVFGRYLFAKPFFWEDVVSMAVIALHTAYVICWFADIGNTTAQFQLALAAYAAYAVNAAQFVYKFRLARRMPVATQPHAINAAGELA